MGGGGRLASLGQETKELERRLTNRVLVSLKMLDFKIVTVKGREPLWDPKKDEEFTEPNVQFH